MKRSIVSVTFLVLSFIASQLFAQGVSITGKVIDSNGSAIEGATVKLLKTGVSATTDASGNYSFKTVSIEGGEAFSYFSFARPYMKNGTLFFTVDNEASRVSVEILNMSGRRVLSPFDKKLSRGSYSLSDLSRNLSSAVYIVKTTIGNKSSASKMMIARSISGAAPSLIRRNLLGSTENTRNFRNAIDTLRIGAHGYMPEVRPLTELQGTVNVTLKKANVNYFRNHIGGYQGAVTNGGFVPGEYSGGYSMYTAAWEIFERYPGNGSQTGLYGTWMHVAQSDNAPKDIYCDIEGGLGWWRNTRFINETPKFIMGAVSDYFKLITNGPGAGNGDYWGDPKGLYGVAQLSPWLLFPPDGLNLKQGVSGELFGYGYLPLPLTNPKNTTEGKNIRTGNNCWTLFLNTENFKGPATFVLPYFWSKPYVWDPRLEGMQFDSKLASAGGSISMESQHMPTVQTTTSAGTYSRVAPLLFPREENGNSITVHDLYYYKASALWDDVQSWFAGGSAASGSISSSDAFHRTFSRHGGGWSIWENEYSGGTSRRVPWENIRTSNSSDPYTCAIDWNRDYVKEIEVRGKPFNLFPEYLRLVNNQWIPVNEEDVPDESGLKDYVFPHSGNNHTPYTTPQESNSVWKSPGPVAGPFYAYPTDGSKVTYYWYKFKDQPSMLMADMTDEEREVVQQRVEKLHRSWTKDKEYLAPPSIDKPLAGLDPAMIVEPPAGFEIGYVPIVTRQELN